MRSKTVAGHRSLRVCPQGPPGFRIVVESFKVIKTGFQVQSPACVARYDAVIGVAGTPNWGILPRNDQRLRSCSPFSILGSVIRDI